MENYDHFRTATELRTGVKIWQIVSPILILFGTTGNIISIIVLSKSRFNRWASSMFLIGLAVADLSILYVGLLRQWVKYTFEIDIRAVHPLLCKVHWWLMYVMSDIPVWILTAITVERLISTLCPYKSKLICSKNNAKIVLGIIVVCALVINSHLLYGFGRLEISVDNVTVYIPCAPLTENYEKFFGNVWPWIDFCKFSILPFAILSSGNVCIIYKLITNRWKVRTRIQPMNPQPNGASTITTSNRSSDDKTSHMSVLLVCLNFAFIMSTLPISVYFIGEPYWIPKDIPRNVQLQDPWWAMANMCLYVNSSANFIMYCLTGSRFRNAVKQLFRLGPNQTSNSST